VDHLGMLLRKGLGVDHFRQRDVEVVTHRVRATAVDYPLLAVSLHDHFPAVRKFWTPLAVDPRNPSPEPICLGESRLGRLREAGVVPFG
jgi:hypothetical protein